MKQLSIAIIACILALSVYKSWDKFGEFEVVSKDYVPTHDIPIYTESGILYETEHDAFIIVVSYPNGTLNSYVVTEDVFNSFEAGDKVTVKDLIR